jgi:hypothetical protein
MLACSLYLAISQLDNLYVATILGLQLLDCMFLQFV